MSDLPLLLTRAQAAQLLGVSASTFSAWVAVGTMPPSLEGTKRWSRVQIERAASGLPWFSEARESPASESEFTWDDWGRRESERDKHRPLFGLNKRQVNALRHLVEHDFSDGKGVRGAAHATFEELVQLDLAKRVRGGWRSTAQGNAEVIRIDTWTNWHK